MLGFASHKHLVDILQHHASLSPHKPAFLFLADNGLDVTPITYGELDQQARVIAAYLQSKNLYAQRILLLYPTGLDFITAFIGCLYAGAIAVPINCPQAADFAQVQTNITVVARDANIAGILTTAAYIQPINDYCSDLLNTQCVFVADTANLPSKITDAYQIPNIQADTTVYLQYTSGSTSVPKGVVIQHQHLLYSVKHTAKTWHYNKHSITLTWAPHSHVYGLICGLLVPLYSNSLTILMSPVAFTQRPLRWLEAITKYRATHSGCPNFGYALCTQEIEAADMTNLDLRSWQVAVNGGESVQYETLLNFSNKFSPYGFSLKHFYSAYGMSEVTGLIASNRRAQTPHILNVALETIKNNQIKIIRTGDSEPYHSFVSIGYLLNGLHVAIVDPTTIQVVEKNAIGEIWLSGPSVAAGYWRRPVETQEIFSATLPNDSRSYFRTGDLGFINDKELYITGRLKEIIIINGKHYYPLDLEIIAARAQKNTTPYNVTAAFALSLHNKEEVIIIQEIEASHITTNYDFENSKIQAIRHAISEHFGIDLYGVILVKPNTIPKTASGKVQHKQCQQRYLEKQLAIVSASIKNEEQNTIALAYALLPKLQHTVINLVAKTLKIAPNKVNLYADLSEYNLDSLNIIKLTGLINETFNFNLTPASLYAYSTLYAFCADLVKKYHTNLNNALPTHTVTDTSVSVSAQINHRDDIAIIGIDGIFPGAANLDIFWENLINVKDSITEIPPERWDWQSYYGDPLIAENKTNIKWGGFIEDIDKFDAAFFNISPRDAELMDPQQRLLLQTVWHAIEDAGYAFETLSASLVGLFVGAFSCDYAELLQRSNITAAQITTGIPHCMLANRVSYLLNLRGPSEVIDTACSSSLVALHHAVRAIQQGDCEIAIAGGVNALLTPTLYLAASNAGMLSIDGACKTFDKSANGYVRSEGVAAIVLKSSNKAQLDGDHIYGIIKGTAVNHGGHVSALTVPNTNAQADVLMTAYQRANIAVDSITYIEAHGTGTTLGDPIEVEGLKKAFQTLRSLENGTNANCGLGTVKTNIGHLESAAGIAGVIKVLLALKYHQLPGTVHFQELNPYIELTNSPFYIVTNTQPWKHLHDDTGAIIPHRTGISSFGFGGTNAHIVIEEALPIPSLKNNKPCYLITFSAKNETALNERIKQFANWLTKQTAPSLAAISYTLNVGRSHFDKRCAIVADSIEELQTTLQQISLAQIPSNIFINIANSGMVKNQPIFQQLLKQLLLDITAENTLPSNDYREKLLALANIYTEGYTVDWQQLYTNDNVRRISLPTYPFAKDRYWYDQSQSTITTRLNSVTKSMTDPTKVQLKTLLSAINIPTRSSKNQLSASIVATPFVQVNDLNSHANNTNDIASEIKNILIENHFLPREKIDEQQSFADMGMDSIVGVELIRKINNKYQLNLSAAKLYDYPTLRTLADYIKSLLPEITAKSDLITNVNSPSVPENNINSDIAIISASGRFPGAKNLQEFWQNLTNGKSAITEIPNERWAIQDFYDPQPRLDKTYSKWGGFLSDVDQFDPLFFNISPAEAEWMDPQQRLFLQITWETLHNTGYSPVSLNNIRCGIFVGVMNNDYHELLSHLYPATRNSEQMIGNANSILAARIAYFLNLKGPALALDTACSSSLVAMHLACKSLQAGETDLMLAGGVTLYLNATSYISMCSANMLSPEGACKTFDATADGFVPGEGAGVVLLKRLADAVRDNDHIYGIIKGSGINQDGKTNGITAPSASAQKELILDIYQRYNINPESISYIEAHGTGTKLGDPIEIEALQNVFNHYTDKKQFCAIGSLKTNLGHTSAAAGVLSVIKVLLCLQHKKLVPSLNYKTPNPHINFAASPFYVNTAIKDWQSAADVPRRAAISAFGFSGTNAHLVIEETAANAGKENQLSLLPNYSFHNARYWVPSPVDSLSNESVASITPTVTTKSTSSLIQIQQLITQHISQLLKIAPQIISANAMLTEFGFDSIKFKELATLLEKHFAIELNPAIFYTYTSIASFSQYLLNTYPEKIQQLSNSPNTNITSTINITPLPTIESPIAAPHESIAIIGMHGRFPQSDNLTEFWQHLIAGNDLITEIPIERWDWHANYGAAKQDSHKTNSKWGGFLKDVGCFDADFFNISAQEAELMDPQQRLLLEVVWKTVEDAAYDPLSLTNQNIGLFVGAEFDEYHDLLMQTNTTHGHVATGCSRSMLANRVSYFMNWHGPSETISTACSSSLVAIHRAINALRNNECTLAVAGGVSIILNPYTYVVTSQLGALSPDGRCKTFDKSANGYVKGEGVATLLLKPLSQAQMDGDHIYGIIKASAVNHGGKAQSLTAPNPNAQSQLLINAYTQADVDPQTITYIEAHGTGTELGDPIEINGLKQAFSFLLSQQQKTIQNTVYCGLGSVKTNIGHLEPASGVAGVIKVLLAMQHAQLPGIVHFKELNPYIDLAATPFYLVRQNQPWVQLKSNNNAIIPRRAGISAFGFGGTNAHLVLEEAVAPSHADITQTKPFYLITLAAKNSTSLKQKIIELSAWLHTRTTPVGLAALSFTLNTCRSHFPWRCGLVVSSIDELLSSLQSLTDGKTVNNCLINTTISTDTNSPLFTEIYKMTLGSIQNYSTLSPAIYREKLLVIADLYTKNYALDWNAFYIDEKPERIAGLPTYPFTKNRYWINSSDLVNTKPAVISNIFPSVARNLQDFTLHYLQTLFANKLKLQIEQISVNNTYEVYGIDSLIGLEIIGLLEKDFGTLPKTLLYERTTLRELASYFEQSFNTELRSLYTAANPTDNDKLALLIAPISNAASLVVDTTHDNSSHNPIPSTTKQEIAIIGISGTYPMAKNIDEFWQNLVISRDAITEIPKDRWDFHDYPVTLGAEKKYFSQGGFINDIDKFDPLLFNIAPRDAAFIDPQERLFLQSTWETLEDAGYTRESLQRTINNSVGVFVGVTYNFYPLFVAEEWFKGNRQPLDFQTFSVANRISYFFNFNGPSYPIDTACSSSLAAIHLACESIARGECIVAIVGGVNLSLHPAKYHMLGTLGLLSTQGRCTSFAAGGSGYVPGEGVGSVLLKPLALAIKDNDHIYAVIKSSSMNHGGKTSGFTVPNPNAQALLIKSALTKANINPRSISYIEAHGTGTALGDPIEIRGLQTAFEPYTQDKQFCAIGSVKSNIGHLESAAGISQLTKVLLQLKYRKLVPSLHADILNPHIDFPKTPFYVQQTLTDWRSVDNQPRRAGISSFGAGGTNVHIIVEEYISTTTSTNTLPKQPITLPLLFLLSAFNSERLQEHAKQIYAFLLAEINNHKDSSAAVEWLADVCYTLQVGRENLASRFAAIITSYDDLLSQLKIYIEHPTSTPISGSLTTPQNLTALFVPEHYTQLVQLWMQGVQIPWQQLYLQQVRQKISLPSYPFAKRRCWTQTTSIEPTIKSLPDNIPTDNLSDLNEWLYETRWQLKPLDSVVNLKDEPNYWLIFSDKELGLHLQHTLGKASCIYCFAGDKFQQFSPNIFYINPNSAADYVTLLEQIYTQFSVHLKGIIYLWTLSDVESNNTSQMNDKLLFLFHALAQQFNKNILRFCLITRGGQAVQPQNHIQLWQHSLWSFARIFATEQPNFQTLLLDFDNKKQLVNEAKIIAQEVLPSIINEYQIAYRENLRYVMRLTHYQPPSSVNVIMPWSAPEAVIITGGLGALGIMISKWLVTQGTKYLLLIGTTVLPDREQWGTITNPALLEKIAAYQDLERSGATVKYSATDVSNKLSMQAVIEQTQQEWRKSILGVFHLAGITTDSIPIAQMSREVSQHVLDVKAQGALVLHELFQATDLHCFILFSSIASIPYFGVAGLSAYAMANEFLNGIAVLRRQQGLKATSISWVAWTEKGMSFKYKHDAFLAAIGIASVSVAQGIQLLQFLLTIQPVNIAIVKIDWQKFLQVNSEARKLTFFSDFFSTETSHVVKKNSHITLSTEQVRELLTTILATLLELKINEIDADTPLQNYGMDSIIGINFISKLAEHFSDTVSPMDLYRYPTINKLVNYIIDSCQTSTIKNKSIEPTVDTILAEINNLDDEQVQKLLAAEILQVDKMIKP